MESIDRPALDPPTRDHRSSAPVKESTVAEDKADVNNDNRRRFIDDRES